MTKKSLCICSSCGNKEYIPNTTEVYNNGVLECTGRICAECLRFFRIAGKTTKEIFPKTEKEL